MSQKSKFLKYLFALLMFFFFIACKQKLSNVAEIEAKLSYTTDSVVAYDPHCKLLNTDKEQCSYIKMRYPKFAGSNSEFLNKEVSKLVCSAPYLIQQNGKQFSATSITNLPQEFFAQRNGDLNEQIKKGELDKESLDQILLNWFVDGQVNADTILNKFITLSFYQYTFQGGTHGSYFTEYHHIDYRNQKPLSLSDFLKNTSDTITLKKIAKENGVWLNAENKPSFFEGEKKFYINYNNFYFNTQGIVFKYQVYEIGAFAEGSFDLLIPFSKLNGILKTEMLE